MYMYTYKYNIMITTLSKAVTYYIYMYICYTKNSKDSHVNEHDRFLCHLEKEYSHLQPAAHHCRLAGQTISTQLPKKCSNHLVLMKSMLTRLAVEVGIHSAIAGVTMMKGHQM